MTSHAFEDLGAFRRAVKAGRLVGCRSLRLRAGLTALPDEILALVDTLEVLDVGGNALADLPSWLPALQRLRVLFCSNNRLPVLPPVLGRCAALSQVGCRDSMVAEVPAESLPPALRWLTLTGNRIEHLPAAIGQRPRLQKLMLAGNRLRTLPETLADATALELLRVSANAFDALPPWLAELPRLAWLAWAGNPFDRVVPSRHVPPVHWSELDLLEPLGQGASGEVFRVQRRTGGDALALKLFKGAMTSDGLPEREADACVAAGMHPNLPGAVATVSDHPDGRTGLLMPLLPAGWQALAGPPDLASCSRDVYAADARFTPDTLLRLARGVGAAAAHLHASGLSHGDLYAHNVLWDGSEGQCVLSDLGAGSFLPGGRALDRNLRRLDVLAWGILLGELIDRTDEPVPGAVRHVHALCTRPAARDRPELAEALAMLAG